MSPGIRDPSLNTAECVIRTEGHRPNIDAPGVSPYIKPILWCLFVSVMLLGPIITISTFALLELPDEENSECCAKELPANDKSKFKFKYCCCNRHAAYRERPLICSADLLCHLLLLIELIIVLYLCFSNTLEFKNVPHEICIPVVCIILEGIVLCVVQHCKCSKCDFCEEEKKISLYRKCIFITCINLLSYHLCWVIVGIMLNPAWGLTVLFVVFLVGVGLLFSIEQICDAISKDNFQPCLTIPAIFIGLCLVAGMTVLVGKSFSGRETADDVMKTALLYVVGVISAIFKFCHQNNPNPNQNNSNSNQSEPNLTTQGNQGTTSGLNQGVELEDMSAASSETEERGKPLLAH